MHEPRDSNENKLPDTVGSELSETAADGACVSVEGFGWFLVRFKDSAAVGETFLFCARA